MLGQLVCRMHGGMSPQALANAEERLKALVHPAITGLQQLIAKADSDSVRLSAIRDLLDRTGYASKQVTEQHGEMVIEVRYADTPQQALDVTPGLPGKNGTNGR